MGDCQKKCGEAQAQELESFLGEEWDNIPNSLLISLVDSMPRRCNEVIEKNGERISY
jgi:hypothetical protein